VGNVVLYIHHLQNSRSQRVIWLLEELGLEYEIIVHKRVAGSRLAPESLRRIHPLAKAPVICDKEVVLAETGAVFQYLLETYGNGSLEPQRGTEDRLRYIYWNHFAEGSFMPYLAMKLVFARIVREAPFFTRPILGPVFKLVGANYLNPNIHLEINTIENHLQSHEWFAGSEFSAADVMMGFMLEAIAGRMAPASSHPNINRFVTRIRSRTAYQRAINRGDWSSADHDKYWECLSG
jgi:glutathione S-transferase